MHRTIVGDAADIELLGGRDGDRLRRPPRRFRPYAESGSASGGVDLLRAAARRRKASRIFRVGLPAALGSRAGTGAVVRGAHRGAAAGRGSSMDRGVLLPDVSGV